MGYILLIRSPEHSHKSFIFSTKTWNCCSYCKQPNSQSDKGTNVNPYFYCLHRDKNTKTSPCHPLCVGVKCRGDSTEGRTIGYTLCLGQCRTIQECTNPSHCNGLFTAHLQCVCVCVLSIYLKLFHNASKNVVMQPVKPDKRHCKTLVEESH